MKLGIKARVSNVDISPKKDSVILELSEHKGAFNTQGNVTVMLDPKATKDLLTHLSLDDIDSLESLKKKEIELDVD